MRAVNLLPRDADVGSSRGRTLPVVVTIGCVAAITVFAGFLGMQASAQADERRGDLELTEAAIARIPARERQPVAPDMSAERSNRISALQSALSTRVPVDKVMRELSYVVPEDVWLNGLTVTVPTETGPAGAPAGQATPGSATATPATVTVKGATYSQSSIARFIARLSALSSLENVRLTESARVEPQADAPTASGAKTKSKSKKKTGRRHVHRDGRSRPGTDLVNVNVGSLTSSRRALVVVAAVSVAVYLLAVWFLFVSPKRAEAGRLQDEVVAAEARLAAARDGAGSPTGGEEPRVGSVPPCEGDALDPRPGEPAPGARPARTEGERHDRVGVDAGALRSHGRLDRHSRRGDRQRHVSPHHALRSADA